MPDQYNRLTSVEVAETELPSRWFHPRQRYAELAQLQEASGIVREDVLSHRGLVRALRQREGMEWRQRNDWVTMVTQNSEALHGPIDVDNYWD